MKECGHKKTETMHSTGTCNYKENYFLYRVNVLLSGVIKINLFRFYPETQRDVWVLVFENAFSKDGRWTPLISVPRHEY